MSRVSQERAERDALTTAATLLAASARTAPKARGVDAVKTLILDGNELEQLASAMERKAEEKPAYLESAFKRDAKNVRTSSCVLLIGVKGAPKKIGRPLDCGACGYKSCRLMSIAKRRTRDFQGPVCMFQALDLGIALGSAVKLAAQFSIDNRIMYTIGVAAKASGLMDSDVIIGIPLSATGKNFYFDRQ